MMKFEIEILSGIQMSGRRHPQWTHVQGRPNIILEFQLELLLSELASLQTDIRSIWGRRKGRPRRRTRHNNNNAWEGVATVQFQQPAATHSIVLVLLGHISFSIQREMRDTVYIPNAADMPLTSPTFWVKKVPAITDGTTLGLIFKKYKEKTRAASLHYTSTRWIQSI